MTNTIQLGKIVIGYFMAPDGDVQTSFEVEGEMPAVTQLGLLAMAQDTILRGT